MPSTYDIRLIQAGSKVEVIEYEIPVIIKDQLLSKKRTAHKTNGKKKEKEGAYYAPDKEKNRKDVLYKARNEMRRLINANVNRKFNMASSTYKPVFLTLTFADNIQEIPVANTEFRKFNKRLGTYIARNQAYVQYVAVPEFQKRGAVHYHQVIFNLPYIKSSKIADIWRNGFIQVKSIEDVDNIGAYMSKYMSKDTDGEDRLIGQKSYLRSRDLYEPIETKVLSSSPQGQELLKTIETMKLVETFSSEQLSDHYGLIRYKQYQIDKGVIQDGKECKSIC